MSNDSQAPDPIASLLAAQHDREQAVRDLNTAHGRLQQAISDYRTAWTTATSAGWARTDLVRAGLTNPERLPRRRTTKPAKPTNPNPAPVRDHTE